MSNIGFRHLIARIAPPRLTRKWGERFLYSFGLVLDVVVDWGLQGMRARFPDKGPEDALPYLGRDRKIVRGFQEPAALYRPRLRRWRIDHRKRGNPIALLEQLAGYMSGFPVRIATVTHRGTWFVRQPDGTVDIYSKAGNWDWDAALDVEGWSRFWVVIYPLATGIWTQSPPWGDVDLFGGAWGAPGFTGTWGSSATAEQVESIRSIIREWKAGGTRCVSIIVAFDETKFDPTDPAGAPLPSGDWGRPAKIVGGTYVPTREPSAIYWDGTAGPQQANAAGKDLLA